MFLSKKDIADQAPAGAARSVREHCTASRKAAELRMRKRREIAMNDELVILVFLAFALLVTIFALWANPDGGRKPRQRRWGIVQQVRARLVRSAAWWFEHVAMAGGAAVEAVVFAWGRPFYPLARIAEALVHRWLLLGWLSWWIAGRYLQWKWHLQEAIAVRHSLRKLRASGFGTSPHGLSADLNRTDEEIRRLLAHPPLCKTGFGRRGLS